jgi:predicted aspartyl protease
MDQIVKQQEALDLLDPEERKEKKKEYEKSITQYRENFLKKHKEERVTNNSSESGSNLTKTKINVINNRIIVPVTLGYSTRKVTTNLLLDTGATGILINNSVAGKLEISNTQTGYARVADGSSVMIKYGKIDYIMVGPKVIRYPEIMIINNKGPKDYTEGLLGMSFLNQFPHTIDLRSKVIKWHY